MRRSRRPPGPPDRATATPVGASARRPREGLERPWRGSGRADRPPTPEAAGAVPGHARPTERPPPWNPRAYSEIDGFARPPQPRPPATVLLITPAGFNISSLGRGTGPSRQDRRPGLTPRLGWNRRRSSAEAAEESPAVAGGTEDNTPIQASTSLGGAASPRADGGDATRAADRPLRATSTRRRPSAAAIRSAVSRRMSLRPVRNRCTTPGSTPASWPTA